MRFWGLAAWVILGRTFRIRMRSGRGRRVWFFWSMFGNCSTSAVRRITHIDAVVITERPKLTPHFAGMRAVLARALGIDAAQINLKAKTNEGVDAIGRGEAIAAQAVATIES